jgi:hypothetical protein
MLPSDFAIFSPVSWIIPLWTHSAASSPPRAARVCAVDVEADAEHTLGHRRALDVPARPALPPGRGPGRVLLALARLPQSEIQPVLLALSLQSLPVLALVQVLSLIHVLQAAVRERAVARIGAHAEQDVAAALTLLLVLRDVGVPGVHERLDVRNDLRHRLGGQRLVIGAADSEGVGVGDVHRCHLARELLAWDPRRLRCGVDLVVDIGHVDDQRHIQALVFEKALHQAEDDERPRVAHVNSAVHRRPARVDTHPARVSRTQRPHLPAACVVQANLAHRRGH